MRDVGPIYMKSLSTVLFTSFLLVANALAGLPEVKGMAKDERITVYVMYSEPQITEYLFEFAPGAVTIRRNGKLLGKLAISEEESAKIDHFLYTVRMAKTASRNLLGAAVYRITHTQSGRQAGEWSYRIESPKKTTKPTLSMRDLLARVERD